MGGGREYQLRELKFLNPILFLTWLYQYRYALQTMILTCNCWPSFWGRIVEMDRSGVDDGVGDLNNTPNNTLSVDEYDYSKRAETYIVPILFAFIFFVGTIGNGSLVLIFFRHKHMINVPNIYILSLALGDLLVLLSCIPFTSTVYTVNSIWDIITSKIINNNNYDTIWHKHK